MALWTFVLPRAGGGCEEAIAERRFPDAQAACVHAFEETGEGLYAASAAMAHLAVGETDHALEWANLPQASKTARATRIRGVVLMLRGQMEEAADVLSQALERALAEDLPGEAARAAHALAGVHWEQGRYTEAYEAIELSEREATRGQDGPALALAILAKGDIFRSLGDAQRADALYRRAVEATMPWPNDHAYALLKVGLYYMDRRAWGLALKHMREAQELATATQNRVLTAIAPMNLALIFARSGDIESAAKTLARLGKDELQLLPAGTRFALGSLRAKIALGRGDPEGALQLLREAAPSAQPDERWFLETQRGNAFRQAGRLKKAEAAYRAAIAGVEALSAREPLYQGWVASRRREPFDALFALLVEQGAHREAFEVVARYALCEAMFVTGPREEDPRRMLEAAEELNAHWSLAHMEDPVLDLDGPGGAELIILHEAEGALYVGAARGGRIHVTRAAETDTWEPLLHRFLGDPSDQEAAEGLGSLLWKAAGVTPGEAPLYVGVTGRLHRMALGALRVNGRPWVSLRPLALLSSLSALPFDPAPHPARQPVAVGDPRGDLPAAREEVQWVASRLGGRAATGEEASRKKVLATQGGPLLHLATHATVRLDGTRLLLADGELTAAEVLEARPHARLVVLATCASGRGRDAAGSDSLATAFLRAGSGAVLSTLRTVPDEAAQALVRAFYEAGGLTRPAVALAQAQERLSEEQPVEVWSAFVLYVNPGSLESHPHP